MRKDWMLVWTTVGARFFFCFVPKTDFSAWILDSLGDAITSWSIERYGSSRDRKVSSTVADWQEPLAHASRSKLLIWAAGSGRPSLLTLTMMLSRPLPFLSLSALMLCRAGLYVVPSPRGGSRGTRGLQSPYPIQSTEPLIIFNHERREWGEEEKKEEGGK
jgi:hypothetical protein